jgi:hypothetical protein
VAQSSWPAPGASRAVTDLQYEQLAAPQYVDGLIGSPTDTPMVYADSSGRQVAVRAGRTAQLRGHGWASGSADVVLPIAANTSGSSRTDLVVLGLDRSIWEVSAYVKTGTVGAGAPALQLDTGAAGIYEMPLAEVTVPAAATVIGPSQVKMRAWYSRPDGAASAGVDTRPPNPLPGMGLWELGTAYVWTGSAWERISNEPAPGTSEQTIDLLGSADIIGDGTWRDVPSDHWPPATIAVPLSGRLRITVSGWAENRLSAGSTIWISYRSVGGGLLPGTVTEEINRRGISARNGRVVASKVRNFGGLIPGSAVTLIPVYFSSAASSDSTVTVIRDGYLIAEPA